MKKENAIEGAPPAASRDDASVAAVLDLTGLAKALNAKTIHPVSFDEDSGLLTACLVGVRKDDGLPVSGADVNAALAAAGDTSIVMATAYGTVVTVTVDTTKGSVFQEETASFVEETAAGRRKRATKKKASANTGAPLRVLHDGRAVRMLQTLFGNYVDAGDDYRLFSQFLHAVDNLLADFRKQMGQAPDRPTAAEIEEMEQERQRQMMQDDTGENAGLPDGDDIDETSDEEEDNSRGDQTYGRSGRVIASAEESTVFKHPSGMSVSVSPEGDTTIATTDSIVLPPVKADPVVKPDPESPKVEIPEPEKTIEEEPKSEQPTLVGAEISDPEPKEAGVPAADSEPPTIEAVKAPDTAAPSIPAVTTTDVPEQVLPPAGSVVDISPCPDQPTDAQAA